MLNLRLAQTSEWPRVAQITEAANAEYAKSVDPDYWQHYEDSTRSTILTEPEIKRFVATHEGEIVGSVVYCPPYEKEMGGRIVKNPYPEMRLLAVLPQCRNLGVARALIQACEDYARHEDAAAITLHTTALMSVAKAMYERRGYDRYHDIDFQLAPGVTVLGYKKTLERGD